MLVSTVMYVPQCKFTNYSTNVAYFSPTVEFQSVICHLFEAFKQQPPLNAVLILRYTKNGQNFN